MSPGNRNKSLLHLHLQLQYINIFNDIFILIGTMCIFLILNPGGNCVATEMQACVNSVDENVFPVCNITFMDSETARPYKTLNATCIENNVFQINPTKNRTDTSARIDYMTNLIDVGVVHLPYTKFTCTSFTPIDFDFEGVGSLDLNRIWKSLPKLDNLQRKVYTMNAVLIITPEASGKYSFYSIENPQYRTSFFIFSERGGKPYMIGGSRTIAAVKFDSTKALLPCIASDSAAKVTLYKRDAANQWVNVPPPIIYDRQRGFSLSPAETGDYRCFGDEIGTWSSDYATVRVHSAAEELAITNKKISVTLDISSPTAVCYSMENRTDLKLLYAHTRNPTEARLMEHCLQQEGVFCGTHRYPDMETGRRIDFRTCPNNATTCHWLTDINPQGVFFCATADEGDFVTQSYFTGLDNVIYTNVSAAPITALISVDWTPAMKTLTSDTAYEFSCKLVSHIFIKDPLQKYTVSVKYRNGTIVVGAQDTISSWRSYVTTEMDEILCSSYLYTTYEVITSGMKINVTEKQCETDQFKCKSGQCIRLAYQCDGDKDCADGSDEECAEHHCKTGYFKCKNGLCMLLNKKCNNKNDCIDGSDETPEVCANMTCSIEEFKCGSGQCVQAHFLCDGDNDCFDKSDENVEHCKKFYPQFEPTRTNVTFSLNPNVINELVCKLIPLAPKLQPTVTWWRRGENISDPDRLWQDTKGVRFALRFDNVSEKDNGEFTCVAVNKLQRSAQVFTVTVRNSEPESKECRPELDTIKCQQIGCVYVNNSCFDQNYLNSISTSTTTEVIKASSTTVATTDNNFEVEGKKESAGAAAAVNNIQESHESDNVGSSGGIVGVILLILAIITVVLIGLGWIYFKRRNIGSRPVRMREESDEFRGIYHSQGEH